MSDVNIGDSAEYLFCKILTEQEISAHGDTSPEHLIPLVRDWKGWGVSTEHILDGLTDVIGEDAAFTRRKIFADITAGARWFGKKEERVKDFIIRVFARALYRSVLVGATLDSMPDSIFMMQAFVSRLILERKGNEFWRHAYDSYWMAKVRRDGDAMFRHHVAQLMAERWPPEQLAEIFPEFFWAREEEGLPQRVIRTVLYHCLARTANHIGKMTEKEKVPQ